MQTEPQLSAEMEKRLDYEFEGNYPYTDWYKVEMPHIKKFFAKELATALEEQRANDRQAVIEEVESWLVDEQQVVGKTIDDFKYPAVKNRNLLRAELRAKLVEMKGKTV